MTTEYALNNRIDVEWLPSRYDDGDYPYVIIRGRPQESEKMDILKAKIAELFASRDWGEE